ncbi:MAG: IS30 family transposase, partial [Firmicutes bacterium]|nr:IS30 family transposase [Bacillota bacterium]
HLTLDDRISIQESLSLGMTFKAIGKHLGKDQTTISKEVKKRIGIIPTTVKRTDGKGNLVVSVCPKLQKAPFVCNPCPGTRKACQFDKHIYSAKPAQDGYKTTLRESREGLPLTKEEFWEVDRVVTKGIRDGQHLYHILQTNDLNVSVPTAYRHLHKDYFSIAAVDLPRVVKFKPRKKKRESYIPKGLKIGRSYNDFQLYCAEHELSTWWEMDTVIGRVGGKCILTFDLVPCNFMFGLLLEDKSAMEVADKIKALKGRLLREGLRFGDIFPEILTDNGCEFANVYAIENSLQGLQETHVFFTDPYRSSQKPHVEKTHTCFRSIVPKGTSFDGFTQDDLNLVFSHVNSAKRKGLNGKSAFEAFAFWHNAVIAELLGILPIQQHDVIQNKKLLENLGLLPKK